MRKHRCEVKQRFLSTGRLNVRQYPPELSPIENRAREILELEEEIFKKLTPVLSRPLIAAALK